jgi:hypothetical protein
MRVAPIAGWRSVRLLFAVLLSAVGLAFWGPAGAADPQAHEFTCSSCHLAEVVDAANAGQLVSDESALCQTCHQNSVTASHPVGVRPQVPPPDAFPLNASGEITCSTCHRVHDPAPGKLRTALEGQSFCEACHQPSFFSGMKDGGISLMGLGHLDASASLSGNIDNFSIQCMSCHEKSGDALSTPVTAAGSGRRNHPIGSRYTDSIDFGGYRPVTGLSEKILLPDGKVSCVSCHVGYSDEHGALVVDNRADRLCQSCHAL